MKAKAKYGQPLRLASTVDMPRDQWLTLRKLGLGSSDAAVAVSLSPYKCPLTVWLKKSGHKEAVLWGIELEPVLAQVYAKRTGYRVRRVNAVLQHPEHPFMLANLDREVVGHPDGPGILEIKTASYHSAPLWEEGVPVTISFHRDGISLPVCQSLLSLLGREAERTDLDLGRCTQLTLNFRNPGSPPVELAHSKAIRISAFIDGAPMHSAISTAPVLCVAQPTTMASWEGATIPLTTPTIPPMY